MTGRVLIVEPDPETAREVYLLFHQGPAASDRRGCEPEMAGCLREALEKISYERFGCVILDANLPDMHIDEAIPLVHAIGHDIPIVVIADHNTLEKEARIRQHNVHYYHLKSFDRDDLKRAVWGIDQAAQRTKSVFRASGGLCGRVLLRHLGPVNGPHN